MLSYTFSEKTTASLRTLTARLAVIQAALEEVDTHEAAFIRRSVSISTIGASTRIENAVLTNNEIDWLDTTLTRNAKTTSFYDQREHIKDKLSKDKERSINEVVGCRAMIQRIYQQGAELFPLTEVTIRGLHKELLQYYPPAESYSGRYKQYPNTVVRIAGGETIPVLTPSEPGADTEIAMTELIDWYNATMGTHPWSVAVLAEFVFRFLAIHPFQDGNGRLGRGLAHLALLQSPDPLLASLASYLPFDRHIEKEREEYYTVLRMCSQGAFLREPTGYAIEHFLIFMIKVLGQAADDFDLHRTRWRNLRDLTESEEKVLQCFKELPELRLRTKLIMDKTELARATINDALRVLQKKDFIQRQGRGAATRYQLIF